MEKINWDILPDEELIGRLKLPEGRLDMVLDTDTYNEVDDQFALAYALLSPERLHVEAVYAAPFSNGRAETAGEGMEKSYDEIVRLLGKMHISPEGLVFKGAERYVREAGGAVDSPAVRDLIARAMARPDGDLLYVVAIGAITNIASALLMEPKIAKKIAVVWLGGHAPSYPDTEEFNMMQDIPAANIVLSSGVPFTMVPCMGVASHMLTTVAELESCIGGKNAICDALIELYSAYEADHFGWAKEIWDASVIGYMVNPDWVPTKLTHSPIISEDSHWAHDERRHMISEAYYCNRNPIFKDMFRKLAAFDND